MAYNTVSVTTSATLILSDPGNAARKSGLVENSSSATVFLGFDDNVTTANGTELLPKGIWETNEPRCYQGNLWGIVASGTADVRYMELL